MEKVDVLIERLIEQYNSKAGREQLRITAQLLLIELEKVKGNDQNAQQAVAVFFPAGTRFNTTDEAAAEPAVKKEVNVVVEEKTQPAVKPAPGVTESNEKFNFFDPMVEIPTLALKQQEINETIATQGESLNEKLKSSSTHKEVGISLKQGPIKDLRKAIGINDQYLFINELFRGDQTMYERSIKTINSFNIYGEAEFWIKRELKLKLAWPEDNEVVNLFDQLVKRRFA
jgi:hypothetical protein